MLITSTTTKACLMRKIYLIDSGVNVIDTTPGYSAYGDFADHAGHGTSMAYIIRSVTSAEIVNVKIPSNPSIFDIVSALSYLLQQEPGIISANWIVEYRDEISTLLDCLADRGFTIVSPVGNSSTDFSMLLPACNLNVICVGSINKSGKIASHCNFSKTRNIDLYANGTNISTIDHNGKPILITGTSAASALVSGLLSRSFFDNRNVNQVNRHLTVIRKFYSRQVS